MRPPRLAEWLLERVVPRGERDAVLGDLAETLSGESGRPPRFPRLWYGGQALLLAAAFAVERIRRGPGREGGRRAEATTTIRSNGGWGMGEWMRELRLAARTLGRKPGFVAAVVSTLALGIGANTAIFSVVNGAILQPLPLPEPDRLVWLTEWWKDSSTPGGSSMNPANFVDLKEATTTLRHMTMVQTASANLSGGERPERVTGLAVGRDFFDAVGVEPARGRSFTAEDDQVGARAVTVLTHQLWQDRFGADTELVGRDVLLDAEPHTVIGILPPGFEFPGSPRFFTSLQVGGQELHRGGRSVNGIARLASGATLEAARTELMAAYERLEAAYPDYNENWSAWAQPLRDRVVTRSHREALVLLSWSVFLVLVIAAVNVANLLLVRSETRHRELAVRLALGAGKRRLLTHFLAESLLLSLVGGIGGMAVGYLGVEAITSIYGSMLPRPDEIGLDGRVLGFALLLAVGVGIVVALVPALRVDSRALGTELRSGARGSSAAGSRLRQALVVGELALAVVLLGTAGLLLASFARVAAVDTGLERPEEVLVAQVALPAVRYDDADAQEAFFGELLRRTGALPGVEAAGITSRLPLFGGTNFTRVEAVGDPERFANFVEWRIVTPGFFDAVGIDLLEGRMLEASDADSDTLRTVLITRTFATSLFPEGSAVGRRIDPFSDGRGLEVVGVVDDLRDLGHERAPPPGMYAMYGPTTARTAAYLMIRVQGDPLDAVPALRGVVEELDAQLPVYGIRTLEEVAAQRLGGRKFSLALTLVFAGMALLLGAVGIYGVISYAVAQRTREMGVRLALGAERSDVVRLVLRHGLRLTVFGALLGLGGSLVAARLVQSQLYGVEATDLLTHLAVVAILAGVAMLATWLPARRASSTDPAVALRSE